MRQFWLCSVENCITLNEIGIVILILTYTFTDMTIFALYNKGLPGSVGPTGSQGFTGATGSTGEKGTPGAPGNPGKCICSFCFEFMPVILYIVNLFE